MQSPANNAGLSDHDRLLILRLQQQQQQQQQQQGGNSVMDRESLLGMSGGAPGAFGGFGGNAPDAMNDRMLLQQLLSERRQASFENTFQQELQRQALTRELAERDYERNLLTQRFGPAASLGFGSAGLGFPGASMDPLGRSQGSGMDAATRLSLLNGGSQLSGHFPSPMLQGVPPGLGGGGPSNGAFGAPGLVRGGQGGDPSLGFDSSITLEARSKQAFPLKLYRMLERAERNGQDDIISFIDDGKAFAIHKPRAFETDIMPSYFNSHRMSSFQRQLNIYVSSFIYVQFVSSRNKPCPNPHRFYSVNDRALSASMMESKRERIATSFSLRGRRIFWTRSSVPKSCATAEAPRKKSPKSWLQQLTRKKTRPSCRLLRPSTLWD